MNGKGRSGAVAGERVWSVAVVACGITVSLTMLVGQVQGHRGEGHFMVGYYYGHDETFEAPADPPWEPTLLVDTHPWELDGIVYELTPLVGSPILSGWVSQLPGFEPLPAEDQEFGGHGFYSWLDPGYSHGAAHVWLHVDQIDAGLAILNPDTLQPIANPLSFGLNFPHTHLTYFVDESEGPAWGTIYEATFHLSDSLGALADSEPFTVQFMIVPEPASLLLLATGLLLPGLRRRRRG